MRAGASSWDVLIIGCGLMGTAMTRRLANTGHRVMVWNRSVEKARALEGTNVEACCGSNAEEAVMKSSNAFVVMFLHDMDATRSMVHELGSHLKGRAVMNMASGNSDEGRDIEALALKHGVSLFVDGCYSGAPARLEKGEVGGVVRCSFVCSLVFKKKKKKKGALMVSTRSGDRRDVAQFESMFEKLSAVWKYAGPTGASRALDYAVVDHFLANYVSFLSGLSLMEAEGVDVEQYFDLLRLRLQGVPDQLRNILASMNDRHASGDYASNPVVKLETYSNFLNGRLPYMKQKGLNTVVPSFYANLVDGADDGSKDFTVLQERLRFPTQKKD